MSYFTPFPYILRKFVFGAFNNLIIILPNNLQTAKFPFTSPTESLSPASKTILSGNQK